MNIVIEFDIIIWGLRLKIKMLTSFGVLHLHPILKKKLFPMIPFFLATLALYGIFLYIFVASKGKNNTVYIFLRVKKRKVGCFECDRY